MSEQTIKAMASAIMDMSENLTGWRRDRLLQAAEMLLAVAPTLRTHGEPFFRWRDSRRDDAGWCYGVEAPVFAPRDAGHMVVEPIVGHPASFIADYGQNSAAAELLSALKFVASQESLMFAECSVAEEIISVAKSAIAKASPSQ